MLNYNSQGNGFIL